ncbi:MAG: LPS-assembly protein LptD [Campylobacteraceae bacterium]|jgi:LPS-assembly protein|nr:LPS-assembly protein LptD [Campylobacteraceae bacterium]
MHKIIVFLSFVCISLFAENVQILSKDFSDKNGTIYANKDVVVYSERYLITADSAKYDSSTKDLELFGNVNIIYGSENIARSEYLFINLETDLGDFSHFFFFNQISKLWLRCDNATTNADYYMAKGAITSSCDIENPDWKIGFSRGELNKNSSFLHVYNALFYVKEIPIFYMPYFAFPTDKTRRTGLLRPEIGYAKDESIFYMQPFYIAPHDSWDLEFDPQIRVERGSGLYSTFRFTDSAYSNGYITAGFFREKESYVNREDLKNREHYGLDLFYDRSSLFFKNFGENAEDGLRLDFKYLNDVDYLNLKTATPETVNRLVTSKLNYFLRDENNYIGLYAKYFIDTDSDDNDETLQELPLVQYHRFLNPILMNNLQYSVDLQYHNYYRKVGAEAQQLELQLPVTFYWSMFDDNLKGSLSENIYMMRVNYDGFNSAPENYGQYLRNFHTLSTYTDLSKAYNNFFHKIYLGAEYIIPSFDRQKGYLDRDEFVPINTDEKQVALKLKQYFYDSDGQKRLVHSLRQPYFFENEQYIYAPLENRVDINLPLGVSLSNELQYSHQSSNVIKSLTYASYSDEKYKLYFSHTYNKNEDNNYLAFNFESKVYNHSSIFAEFQYDIDSSFTKSWNIGFLYSKRCWDYRIMYKEDITPKLVSSGKASAVDKKGIYLLFNLYPLGGVKYEYSTSNSKEL